MPDLSLRPRIRENVFDLELIIVPEREKVPVLRP